MLKKIIQKSKRFRWYMGLFMVGLFSRLFGVSLVALALWREGYITLSSDMRDTGELFLLHKVLPCVLSVTKPAVFFDVGAHRGKHVLAVLKQYTTGSVYAFEPSEEPRRLLTASITPADVSRVRIIPCAVGEHDGITSFAVVSRGSGVVDGTEFSSRDMGAISYFMKEAVEVTVPMVTIDTYCATEKVEYISFLKIDAEGFDREVLLGAERMITEHRVGVVQFECNQYLSKRGLTREDIEKLVPNHHCFRLTRWGLMPFGERDRHFKIDALYNVCAIPKEQVELVLKAGYIRGVSKK